MQCADDVSGLFVLQESSSRTRIAWNRLFIKEEMQSSGLMKAFWWFHWKWSWFACELECKGNESGCRQEIKKKKTSAIHWNKRCCFVIGITKENEYEMEIVAIITQLDTKLEIDTL